MVCPKISVIVPIYNVEYYLEEALESMVNQTFLDEIEVLMIDDGSTDNSRYIIEKYALDYDNFHAFHKENGGVSSARNYGLDVAKGEYIHFLDSDDYVMHDAYEKLYNFASSNEYDCITFDYVRFDSRKTWTIPIRDEIFKNLQKNIEDVNLYSYQKLSWDMLIANKLYKREFLEENNIKFYHENILHEDNLFNIEVYAKAGHVGALNEVFYCWRFREKGKSLTQGGDMFNRRKFCDMVNLVNTFLLNNIDDKLVLSKKYMKLLTLDLLYFISDIRFYPIENQELLFEYAYEMVNLVPNEFFETLNSYFKVLYNMVKNKDWDNLLIFLSHDFKRNPLPQDDFDLKYFKDLNFKKDSHFEELNSFAKTVLLEDNCIAITFENFVPFNLKDNFEKFYFKLVNNSPKDIIFDSRHISDDKLSIPIDLIQVGENRLITNYFFDNIKKENFMNTNTFKVFCLNNCEVMIKRDKFAHLNIIKREKNDIELKITDVKLINNENFKFYGFYNEKLENICINDYFDFTKIKYDINYINDFEFFIDIPYVDFLKSPIKLWELGSDDKFNKINLVNEFKFFNENYEIFVKNHYNNIVVELRPYDSLEKIKNSTKIDEMLLEDVYRFAKVKFRDMDLISNQPKVNDWYLLPGVTKTKIEDCLLIEAKGDKGIYAHNLPFSNINWNQSFCWSSPFHIEFDVIEWCGFVFLRISDDNNNLSKHFDELSVKNGSHVKVVSTRTSISYFIDDHYFISFNESLDGAQIGFRLMDAMLKLKNFIIY